MLRTYTIKSVNVLVGIFFVANKYIFVLFRIVLFYSYTRKNVIVPAQPATHSKCVEQRHMLFPGASSILKKLGEKGDVFAEKPRAFSSRLSQLALTYLAQDENDRRSRANYTMTDNEPTPLTGFLTTFIGVISLAIV